MLRDSRWLIMAIIFFMSLAGPWRTLARLEDAIAFGNLDLSIQQLFSRIQRFRLLSLLGLLAMVLAYLFRYPFPLENWVWWAAGVWVLFSINHMNEGLRVLEGIEKK